MRVDNIVSKVAKMLAREDLTEYLNEGTAIDISQVKSEKELIVECLNSVLEELASSQVKLKAEQVFSVADKKIYYKDFTERLLGVCSIKDSKGKKVEYDLFPEYIRLYSDKEVIVLYNYLPKKVEFTDQISVGSTKITEQVLCYGTMAEYCLVSALYEEAVTWRKKFEEALTRNLFSQKYKIKGRVFV